jgi:hypothetical protein
VCPERFGCTLFSGNEKEEFIKNNPDRLCLYREARRMDERFV